MKRQQSDLQSVEIDEESCVCRLALETSRSKLMSPSFQRTPWCYISEDRILHNHDPDKLKSYNTDQGFMDKAAFKVTEYLSVILI
jgi:hypothetical protein